MKNKADWEVKRLGDVCEFKNGRSFSKNEWQSTGIPIIRIQNLNSRKQSFNYFQGQYNKDIEINRGDLLFSWSGTIGSSFGAHIWDREKGVLNQHIYKVNYKSDLNGSFLYHYLVYITNEIEKKTSGAVGLVHITKAELNKFNTPLPPLPIQAQIVQILDQAFAAIDKAKANAEKNLKNAKEIFASYLNNIFSNPGDGWEVKKLGDVCNIVGGGTPSKSLSKYYGGEILWATVRDMRNCVISDTEHKITQEAIKHSATKIIPQNNIVIATRVGLGKVCKLKYDTAINQDLKGIIPKNNNSLIVDYLFAWLMGISDSIRKEGIGATVKGVKLPFINSLLIPLPPLPEQQQIVTKLDSLSVKTKQLEAKYLQKLANLEELKKSILHKAFSGELTSDGSIMQLGEAI